MPDNNENPSSAAQSPPMPRGSRYAGQPMDASSRRSIEIQPGADGYVRIDPADGHAVVDGFYHEGAFWRARIPLDGVDRVFGQAFNFSKAKTRQGPDGREIVFDKHGLPRRKIRMLNHVQSRFVLKTNHFVDLYPQGADTSGTPAARLADFIYSVEAVGPLGVTFNLRDGLGGNLISAHRFLSTREMVFERIVVENQYVTESPPLPLSEGERRALLVESLQRGHRAGMSETYYLFRFCGTNNCTSGPLQILDQVVAYSFRQRIGSTFYRLPLNPRFYLRVRGMDSDPGVRQLVRNEFDVYIQDPQTRKRKREYVKSRIRQLRAARTARENDR